MVSPAQSVEILDCSQKVINSLDATRYTPAKFAELLKNDFKFPENPVVTGDLILTQPMNIRSLPDNLFVTGFLSIEGCFDFSSLPKNLRVGRDLQLHYCINLSSFAEGLVVHGKLSVHFCSGLAILPSNTKIEGDIDFEGCTKFTAFEEGFDVKGNVRISNCPSFKLFPEGFKIPGTLFIAHCPALPSIPGLQITSNMYVRTCNGLTSLSNELRIEGDVDFESCNGLTILKDDFYVGRSLRFFDCSNLSLLPVKMNIKGNINLAYCKSLKALPSWIANTDLRVSKDRIINLTGVGVAETLFGKITSSVTPNIRFRISPSKPTVFANVTECLKFWCANFPEEFLNRQKAVLLACLQPIDIENILCFLSKLTETAEYKNTLFRPLFENRVRQAFAEIAYNMTIKSHACELLKQNIRNAADQMYPLFLMIEQMIVDDKLKMSSAT